MNQSGIFIEEGGGRGGVNGPQYESGREPIIVNFHMHVCDMIADQKCQSHIHDTGLSTQHIFIIRTEKYKRYINILLLLFIMLRIDREGIINDVIMHGT